MIFEIVNKVAIVTGGASGIGLSYVKELLRNGVKGVTIVDINQTLGDQIITELDKEFGTNKVIFVRADVTVAKEFEGAFLETIHKFKYVDVLINNAGIACDALWDVEIGVNLNGTVYGILLGMEKYFPKYKQGDEALIVNTSSVAGIDPYSRMPIYSATKHAVVGLTRSWGTTEHYEAIKVRVVAICPGGTRTPLLISTSGRYLGGRYEDIPRSSRSLQEPEFLAKEAIEIIKYADNGTVWVVEGGKPAYQYIFPDREIMKKNILHRPV